ncbi:ribose-phosphate pyrophosphokinase [Candidatus Poribacteria bacterium]|nr:ribose-phosphate pyrophosphokinase [Candidatus Poribacteria bacterium]
MSTVNPLVNDFKLFCGRANPDLGKEIAEILSVSLGKIRISTFADSEVHVQIDESIRGKDIYIVQSTCEPVNENLMELLVMLDAFRRASAHQITAIIPYYGYARQDHKSTGREPISAKLVADLITTAGANRVVSVDLHATQIQGFFNIPMDHLTAVPILANYFKENTLEDAVIVSPDVGRAKLADKYTDILHLPMALMNKRRSGVGGKKVEFLEIVGDVKGKTPIIIDDVIASGSIAKQAEELVKAGSKEAYIAITHPVLVGPAMERLQSPAVKELIVTNTILVPEKKRLGGKVKVLSIAPLLAKAIQRIHQHLSVSQVFMEENILFPV